MTTRKRSQFMVRQLRTDAELIHCLDLDHAYITDYVWQVDVREENDDIAVRFRTVRLPRTMQVPYPRDRQTLAKAWEQRDCFLVATVDEVVLGYVNMRVDATHAKGWIHDLVIGEPFRRRRIGSALLEQTFRWAQLRDLQQLTMEMQTKNYPAIRFAQVHGFVFCGFNDHYYTNQDIALFFGKGL
jgi:ribosomal protein S18 acetylase RimI-like enzyme